MAKSFRNALLLAKVEATEGVDAAPVVGADAVLVNDVSITPQADIVESAEYGGFLDVGEPIIGGTPMQITIDAFVKGSGTAGTAPEISALLQACGLDETIVAVTSVTYAPISTGIVSCTIHFWRDGLLWKLTGCRGNVSMTMVTRQAALWSFTMQGRFASITDDTPGAATLDSTRPVPWRNGAFTIATVAAAVQSVSWDLNNTLTLPDNPNDAEGFDAPVITGRDIQGSMNPLETTIATRDLFTIFRAGTTQALLCTFGTAGGNITNVAIPAAKYRGDSQVDRGGLLAVDIPFSAVSSDDGVSIAFT